MGRDRWGGLKGFVAGSYGLGGAELGWWFGGAVDKGPAGAGAVDVHRGCPGGRGRMGMDG